MIVYNHANNAKVCRIRKGQCCDIDVRLGECTANSSKLPWLIFKKDTDLFDDH
jgi:hypothetical protein